MLKLSRNLKVFAILALIYSVLFNYYYNTYIFAEVTIPLIRLALIYGVAMFLTGLLLGFKDPVKNSRIDQGFQYHFVTYIIVNAVHLAWPLFAHNAIESPSELPVTTKLITLVAWGIGLLVHYFVVKQSIKGIPKDEVFD